MYTYATTVSSLANTLVIPATNAEFLAMIPSAIDYAEQRLYRDLDLLSTIVRDTSGTLTANSRNFTFPQHIIVSESINVFTPVGTTNSRRQLTPVAREWLDAVWGNEAAASTPSIPEYYAMITDQTIIVGPSPDAAYTMEVVGTIRPTPLSATNTTSLLSLYLPDLWFDACMIFGVGYLKDYGAATDDPNAAGSWEAQYQKLLPSANVEEMRKRYGSQGWTAKQPDAIATPQRV